MLLCLSVVLLCLSVVLLCLSVVLRCLLSKHFIDDLSHVDTNPIHNSSPFNRVQCWISSPR